MSLRLQINLLIAAIMTLFVAAVLVFEVMSTRNSVREEIQASNIVAAQLMSNFDWTDQTENGGDQRLQLVNYLSHLGRVRATEISLLNSSGGLIYHSPPSVYKAGRDAPAWYAALVRPEPIHQQFELPGGRLVIEANASRAVLDGWDDAVRLLEIGVAIMLIGNLIVFWLVGLATRPFRRIVIGLQGMQAGEYATRLPDFAGAEASAISHAFNRMAQAIQDNLGARQEAAEANLRLEQSRDLALIVQNRVEDERRQIARELHDETSQSVTAIRSLAQSLVNRFRDGDETTRDVAQLIADTTARLYDSMHELIPRLRPLALGGLRLSEALEEQIAQWRRQYPETEFSLTMQTLPDQMGETYLLAACRIVQEAVVNALRHAHSARIEIAARGDGNNLVLSVRDRGHGLPPDWQRSGRFGIRGMRERARTLGGDVHVADADGGGVCVDAALPLG